MKTTIINPHVLHHVLSISCLSKETVKEMCRRNQGKGWKATFALQLPIIIVLELIIGRKLNELLPYPTGELFILAGLVVAAWFFLLMTWGINYWESSYVWKSILIKAMKFQRDFAIICDDSPETIQSKVQKSLDQLALLTLQQNKVVEDYRRALQQEVENSVGRRQPSIRSNDWPQKLAQRNQKWSELEELIATAQNVGKYCNDQFKLALQHLGSELDNGEGIDLFYRRAKSKMPKSS